MGDDAHELEDVLVMIDHPFGQVERSLTDWMADGPGPRAVRPVSARSRSTGKALPLTVIPLPYRNDRESRALIESGQIVSPWPGQGGEPRPFDGNVKNPDDVDRMVTRVLESVSQSSGDAEVARHVLDRIPEFGEMAPAAVRRLAAEARWGDFDAIIGVAGASGLAGVGSVLCEVLDSGVKAPNVRRMLDVLVQLRFDDAAETLRRQLGRHVYADKDFSSARLCLHALAAMFGPKCRSILTLISWADWPPPIREWAVSELEATGTRIPSPYESGAGSDS